MKPDGPGHPRAPADAGDAGDTCDTRHGRDVPDDGAEPGGFAAAFLGTLGAVRRDVGLLLILLVAPLVYGFFYPWPYGTQAVQRVPVAIVDQDRSALSRQITRFAQAHPRISVQWVTADVGEARAALWRGEIDGYALLPADLRRDVLHGRPVIVPVEANGAYALLNKAVSYGFAEAVGTVSAGVEIRRLQAGGQSVAQAAAGRSPLQLQRAALFNPTEGYGSYVVPAVALLILQQTLLMGSAMLAGTLAEARRLRARATVWAGRIAALSACGLITGLFFFGWVFWLQDYPRGGNPWAALVLLLVYVPGVCAAGLLLGCWMGGRERALQVLMFTALPMAFLAGFSWPTESLPAPLQWLSQALPSTSAIQASLRLNQMGAPLADVWPWLVRLALLGAGALLALLWVGRPRRAPRRPLV
ncbi:MAG: ABC transporter permease [Comamonadaceae bacterium]|nr:MAG: ABC transporter permease [Comamonadaceae bacterium]